jgi:hypothetical protein
MVVLVLRFCCGRKVHSGRAVITTISTGGVTRCVGSGRHCLGAGRVGIIGVAREGSVALDLVVEFYAQFYKFVETLGLIGLLNETVLEFLRESWFESGLLYLGVVIQNRH